ncbi:MAG TPA: T9SS type A sorting domain-containing protein [Bacteroidia bacterium]|nr:T9SS type A sorting domain-containing protein [Bacteroidia bacterium]
MSTLSGTSWEWDTLNTGSCSGSKGFLLNAGGPANLSTILYSPWFDLTGINPPIICFSQIVNSSLHIDGLRLDYELNNSGIWDILGSTNTGSNWYNSPSLISSGMPGWSGNNSICINSSSIIQFFTLGCTTIRYRFVATSASTYPIQFFIDDFRFCDTTCACNIGAGEQELSTIGKLITLAPNPANNSVSLSVYSESTQMVMLFIRSITGKTVYQSEVRVNEGKNSVAIQLDDLSPGTYVVQVNMATSKSDAFLLIKLP